MKIERRESQFYTLARMKSFARLYVCGITSAAFILASVCCGQSPTPSANSSPSSEQLKKELQQLKQENQQLRELLTQRASSTAAPASQTNGALAPQSSVSSPSSDQQGL